jgi:hypothetical protein
MKAYKYTQQSKVDKIVTPEQWTMHRRSTHCCDCNVTFTKWNESKDKQAKIDNKCAKVLHHDHITGEYISTICQDCNLQYRYKPFIPIVLHNMKGYDAHFIIPRLSKYGQQGCDINCIPNNEEKFLSFSKKIVVDSKTCPKTGKPLNTYMEIRFIDSFGFMSTSLEKLVNNLKSGCKSIDEKRQIFKHTSDAYTSDELFEVMTSKGVYPYEYVSSYSKLTETKHLPKRKHFYSSLNNTMCSKKDYERAQHAWKVFGYQITVRLSQCLPIG